MKKKCSHCKEMKEKASFKNNSSVWCLDCTKEYFKAWRRKNTSKIKEYNQHWKASHPEYVASRNQRRVSSGQTRANNAVGLAVRKGLLWDLKQLIVSCVDCLNRATVYDHRDYNKPLDVEPVCLSCNYKRGSAKYLNRRSCG